MLKPINNVANRVTDGRRYASRSIVISKLSAIACFVFRRQTISAEEGESREDTIWEGGQVLSDQDEHATEYIDQGYAMMVFDSFVGGSIHSDGDDINIGEALVYAQIEPFFYENYPNKSDMLRHVPNWKPRKGDVFGLVISDDLIKWLECVGVTGQSVHANHGERYALNVRDSLMHLEPFNQHQNTLLPKKNIFPIKLNNLVYSPAPIYELDSDEVSEIPAEKVFKLVSFTAPEVATYPSVIQVKAMAKKTNSPYFLSEADQSKVTVDIGEGENFILMCESPIHSIETNLGNFSNLLFMIDNIAVVNKINADLMASKAVIIQHEDVDIVTLTSANFDQEKNTYHFILFVKLGAISSYVLKFDDAMSHQLLINTEAMEVIEG